jgi:hypothetical protein
MLIVSRWANSAAARGEPFGERSREVAYEGFQLGDPLRVEERHEPLAVQPVLRGIGGDRREDEPARVLGWTADLGGS